jgi:Ca2+-transporting ATPase
MVIVGSKAEMTLLQFAMDLGWPDYKKTREAAQIVQLIPFSNKCKSMGVVVRPLDGRHRAYLRDASEILTKKCARHVVVNQDGRYLTRTLWKLLRLTP